MVNSKDGKTTDILQRVLRGRSQDVKRGAWRVSSGGRAEEADVRGEAVAEQVD